MVVVSNRLPVVISQVDGAWQVAAGSGGLITALAPVVQANQGVWIGWAGCSPEAPVAELCDRFALEHGYRLETVDLSEEEIELYYHGFANETLWPLFHDLLGNCLFSTQNYRAYEAVNRKFADATAAVSGPADLVWIHDYQLIRVGHYLRAGNYRRRIAFFLHIPFPPADLFRRLPWKDPLLEGLLAYDLIGFQTLRDRRNFVHCATTLCAGVEVVSRHLNYTVLDCRGRRLKVGHFPISIDYQEFATLAATPEVADAAWYLHENFPTCQVMLGVDRLDYTKGIPERFLALERALEKYPALQRCVSLLQIVVPSRTLVPGYQDLKDQLDQLAGRINSRFGDAGWMPILYRYCSLDQVELAAHYRMAEIALVTPLRDGMNLVAKEYCACSVDNSGVLILSEFAGAADQLGGQALLVNPYDIEATADIIQRAWAMPVEERQRRMSQLRAQVKRYDVHRWVTSFINAYDVPAAGGY
jgi:trehalose 6-phosphate synthase